MKNNKFRTLLPIMTICMALTGCADTQGSVYTSYVPVDYRNDTGSEPAVTESAPADEPAIAPEDETDDTPAALDDTPSPSTPENPADNTELTPVTEVAGYKYHRPTAEERWLAAMQSYELEQINELRKSLGISPLVFDSELAAIGNIRHL